MMLREATDADRDAIVVLCGEMWSPSAAVQIMSMDGVCVRVAEQHGLVVGAIFQRTILDEAELLWVSVRDSDRGCGVARALLADAEAVAHRSGARTMHLEVRASNAAARALYGSAGYRATGLRRAYYSAPVEDAITMAHDLTDCPAAER